MLAADNVAVFVDGAQRFVPVSPNALVSAGEKAMRSREVGKIICQGRSPNAAENEPAEPAHPEDEFRLHQELDEGRIGDQILVRPLHLDEQAPPAGCVYAVIRFRVGPGYPGDQQVGPPRITADGEVLSLVV